MGEAGAGAVRGEGQLAAGGQPSSSGAGQAQRSHQAACRTHLCLTGPPAAATGVAAGTAPPKPDACKEGREGEGQRQVAAGRQPQPLPPCTAAAPAAAQLTVSSADRRNGKSTAASPPAEALPVMTAAAQEGNTRSHAGGRSGSARRRGCCAHKRGRALLRGRTSAGLAAGPAGACARQLTAVQHGIIQWMELEHGVQVGLGGGGREGAAPRAPRPLLPRRLLCRGARHRAAAEVARQAGRLQGTAEGGHRLGSSSLRCRLPLPVQGADRPPRGHSRPGLPAGCRRCRRRQEQAPAAPGAAPCCL